MKLLSLRGKRWRRTTAHDRIAERFGSVRDRVRLACGILGTVFVAQERGQTSDQLGATRADAKRGRGCVLRQIFAKQSPAGDSAIVGGKHGGHSADRLHDLKAAFSAILTSIPEIGRENGKFDGEAFAQRDNLGGSLGQRQIGTATLAKNVEISLGIDAHQKSRQHIKAVIDRREVTQRSRHVTWTADVA